MKISGDVDFLAARFEPDNSFYGSNCTTGIKSTDGSSISKVIQVGTTNRGAAPSVTNHSSFTTLDSQVVQRKDANPIMKNLGEQQMALKRHRKRKRRRINNGSACPSLMLPVDEGCSSRRYQVCTLTQPVFINIFRCIYTFLDYVYYPNDLSILYLKLV